MLEWRRQDRRHPLFRRGPRKWGEKFSPQQTGLVLTPRRWKKNGMPGRWHSRMFRAQPDENRRKPGGLQGHRCCPGGSGGFGRSGLRTQAGDLREGIVMGKQGPRTPTPACTEGASTRARVLPMDYVNKLPPSCWYIIRPPHQYKIPSSSTRSLELARGTRSDHRLLVPRRRQRCGHHARASTRCSASTQASMLRYLRAWVRQSSGRSRARSTTGPPSRVARSRS